jgi:AraC-like DNA-binding protein
MTSGPTRAQLGRVPEHFAATLPGAGMSRILDSHRSRAFLRASSAHLETAVRSDRTLPVVSQDAGIGTAFSWFRHSGELPDHSVRPVIDASWRRCHQARLDPDRWPTTPPPRAPASLRHQELMDAGEGVLSHAEHVLAGCGTVMTLTDHFGVVLRISGDDAALAAAMSIGLSVGSTWTESSRGTNALGVALEVGAAVHVHGSEHYCAVMLHWTSAADVIRDPADGRVLGAVSVAGPSDAFDPHLLPLVVASADRIRAALSQQETQRREQLLEYAFGLYSRKDAVGLMVFDRYGTLLTSDARADAALSAFGLSTRSECCAHIQALDVCACDDTDRTGLPYWLPADWIEPVLVATKRVGTIVTLPSSVPVSSTIHGGMPRYKLRRVIEFINARMEGTISLDDLAQVAGLSRSHFHRLFKKSLGMTPYQYLVQARIERAKELLLESDQAVADVAATLGFADQSHFSNVFRRHTSITPRAFRNSAAR